MLHPLHISQHDPVYPPALHIYLDNRAPAIITARGNLEILLNKTPAPLVALFGSVQCSSAIILQTYELARTLRDAGVTVISGFHAPLEKECVNVLLDGPSPVIICPTRSIERLRLPAGWKAALSQGRFLLLSLFAEPQRHATAGRAQVRN